VKFLLSLTLFMSSAWAQHGADVLLNKAGVDLKKEAPAAFEAGDFKLTDAYLQTLFMEWRQAKGLSREVDTWIQTVLAGRFSLAAQQWSELKAHSPLTQQTWIYLTWKLQLPQTFVDAYLADRMSGESQERLRFALDQVLNSEVTASWVAYERPSLRPAQINYLTGLAAPVGAELELMAFAARYKLDLAAHVLTLIPMGHPQSFTLAATAVLNYTRKNEMGEAGKLLKRRVEPEIEQSKAVKELARHYLTLGRLLYQAGAFDASEAFYTKVPRGVAEYIPARTERTWALLRLNRVSELRGELTSLSHEVFTDRFLPEVGLVRSVSHLKLCRFDEVVKEFDKYIETHKVWAKRIEEAQKNPTTAKIDMPDERINQYTLMLAARVGEQERLEKMSLPSLKTALDTHVAELGAELLQQKRRFWKNREVVLTEAIRKMKFVRIEALSQLRLAQANPPSIEASDIIKRIDSSREKGIQVYPVDAVYWPDELFHLHSAAATRCGGRSL
jgi:hypothetical protein